MWLLFLLLARVDLFVTAENVDEEIKDGELSRKILGQSVVTSVSVVMDIGNGTKTIFTDPLGKPVERPSSSSDLASPINLLNPDRYEFYTFDDSGNLVRRLMSLDEIKGIIATGDSDGLEYDSVLSESYIPEKRVNDVLSNVQNVLKEEMEIHNTKLDGFPTLDTPDVSDSWNMILPAVFGNSGADFTPEKPALHVTPDTIMIEPTERTQSTSRSTPILSSSTQYQPTSSEKNTDTSSISVSSPSTTLGVTEAQKTTSSIASDEYPNFHTEPKEDEITLMLVTETATKEYIPVSTISSQNDRVHVTDKITTITETETTVKSSLPSISTEYIKIDPIVSSTEVPVTEKMMTDSYTSNFESFTTATTPALKINSTNKIFTATEGQTTTNLPELTLQSVESSVNCTTMKNESETATTEETVYDEENSVDKIAGPEILNQLLSTPLVNNFPTDLMMDNVNHVLNDNLKTYDATDRISTTMNNYHETTIYTTEATTVKSEQNTNSSININLVENSTEETVQTSRLPDPSKTDNNSYIVEETSVVPTTATMIESTLMTVTMETNTNPSMSTEKIILLQTSTENQTKPVQLSSDIPVKNTKIEDTKETTLKEEQLEKSTPRSQIQDNLKATTIFIPLPLIDSSTIITNYLNDTTIRIPLIDPSESKNTIKPTADVFINESQNENLNELNNTKYIVPSTESYNKNNETKKEQSQISINNTAMSTSAEEIKNDKFNTHTTPTKSSSLITEKNSSIMENISSATEKMFSPTKRIPSTTEKQFSTTENISSTSENISSATERISPLSEKMSSPTEGISLTTVKMSSPTKIISSPTERISSTTERIYSTVKMSSPTERISSTVKMSSSTERISSPIERISSTTVKLPSTSKIISTTERVPLTTRKISPVIETKPTENPPAVSKGVISNNKETNWSLVPTIAPHSAGTFGTPPPTSESYPDVFELSEPINLKSEPLSGFGLEETTSSLDKDIYQFSQLYNELAFEFWKTTTDSLSHARSLVLSPFGTISLLAMIFLGARGSTSAEMNEILKLDDMITFNPHLVLKNVGESIMNEPPGTGVVTSAFIRELFMCRMKGKLLPFYKERVRAFYDGYAEEVNFAEIGDIIRRRTNLQVKKHSANKILEFLTDTSVIGRPPLVGLGSNIFQTDCSGASSDGRDAEMHFTVLPSIRQRRLVPIPAVLYKSGFLAGYEPSLDATAFSIGGKNQTVSTIFVMPGQQGTPGPGDGLARLEKSLVESSLKKGAWSRLLRSLIPRSGLEVQIPKFIHKSVLNITESLKKMGFVELFKKGQADLVGMNGISNELFLSDMIQINQFTTCGERRTEHHSEVYPISVGKSQRNLRSSQVADDMIHRSLEDPLRDLRYLDLPLPLRPRQARKPDTPRLKFDRPFLYFVRHNPTGLILHIGRFNPRLLP